MITKVVHAAGAGDIEARTPPLGLGVHFT